MSVTPWILSKRTLDHATRLAWLVAALSLIGFGLIRLGVGSRDLIAVVYGTGVFSVLVGMTARWRTERGVWMMALLFIVIIVFMAGIVSFEVFDALRAPPHRMRLSPIPPGEIAAMAFLAGFGWTAVYVLLSVAIWNWRLTHPRSFPPKRPPPPPHNGSPVPARLGPGPHSLAAMAKRGVPGEPPHSTVQRR